MPLRGQLGNTRALITRDDDALFSTFVNAVAIATINTVYDDISRDNSNEMPIIELFGAELRFMLRDVIRFSGNFMMTSSSNHIT